jgi:hypothetical protein
MCEICSPVTQCTQLLHMGGRHVCARKPLVRRILLSEARTYGVYACVNSFMLVIHIWLDILGTNLAQPFQSEETEYGRNYRVSGLCPSYGILNN